MDLNKEDCKCCAFKKNTFGKISKKPTNKSKLKKDLKKYDEFLTKKIEDVEKEIAELFELTICNCDEC